MITRYTVLALLLCLTAMLLLPLSALAEDDRNTVLEGRFVQRKEVHVGEGEALAIVVKVPERGNATIVVPRRNGELMELARSLKEGDTVRVQAVREGEQWWVKTLRRGERAEPEREEGEREREAERERDGERERKGDRNRDRDGERERNGDRERVAERERDGDRERAGEREREGERERDVDRERERDREVERDREERDGVIEGWHATQTQVRVGDQAFTGLLVRVENGDWLLVVVPRENDRILTLARRLERDDRVRITFERYEGRRWLTGLSVSAK